MTDAGTGHHPPDGELVAYHAGELSPEDEDRIQEHLLGCRECTDLLLALSGLHHPEQAAPVPAGELEAVWDGLQAKLPVREAAPAPLPFVRRAPAGAPRWLQALAAALLVVAVGLAVRVASLSGTVEELSRPQANAPVVDLLGPGVRGAPPGPAVVELAPETLFYTLLLTPEAADAGVFEAEITPETGGPALRVAGLRRNEYRSLSLTLSRRTVGPGRYRVRLFATGSGDRSVVGEHELEVRER